MSLLPSSHVLNFRQEFALQVGLGSKCTSIRAPRKRPIAVGDCLNLGTWARRKGSTRKFLGWGVVTSIQTLTMRMDGVALRIKGVVTSIQTLTMRMDGVALRIKGIAPRQRFEDWNWLATADGFLSVPAMANFFEKMHGLPFSGVLIEWHFLTDELDGLCFELSGWEARKGVA